LAKADDGAGGDLQMIDSDFGDFPIRRHEGNSVLGRGAASGRL
jgi:hypothetical protein